MTQFTEDEFNALVPAIIEYDADAIRDWMHVHMTDRQSHAQMFETLPRIIAGVWPLGLTAGIAVGTDEFWGIKTLPGSSSTGLTATQLIVAGLNDDEDAITGLTNAVLDDSNDPAVIGGVLAHLVRALHDGFAAIRKNPEPNDSESGADRG